MVPFVSTASITLPSHGYRRFTLWQADPAIDEFGGEKNKEM